MATSNHTGAFTCGKNTNASITPATGTTTPSPHNSSLQESRTQRRSIDFRYLVAGWQVLASAEANVGRTLGKVRGGPTDHSFRRGPSAYRGNEPADHIGGSRAPPERGADRRCAPARSSGIGCVTRCGSRSPSPARWSLAAASSVSSWTNSGVAAVSGGASSAARALGAGLWLGRCEPSADIGGIQRARDVVRQSSVATRVPPPHGQGAVPHDPVMGGRHSGPALPRGTCYPAGLMFGLRWKTLPGS